VAKKRHKGVVMLWQVVIRVIWRANKWCNFCSKFSYDVQETVDKIKRMSREWLLAKKSCSPCFLYYEWCLIHYTIYLVKFIGDLDFFLSGGTFCGIWDWWSTILYLSDYGGFSTTCTLYQSFSFIYIIYIFIAVKNMVLKK
jgi:hypothetical protein